MPLIFRHEINKGIQLGLWKIEGPGEVALTRAKLTGAERASLESLKNPGKQLQRLAYRAVLHELTRREDLFIAYDTYRKPHLINAEGHISVSHSGDLAAAMININGPAGIDVEKVSQRIQIVAHRFLSEREREECGDQTDLLRLTLYWSAKEALYKMHGKRGLGFDKDIYIPPFDTGLTGKMSGRITRADQVGTFPLEWMTFDDYVLVYTL